MIERLTSKQIVAAFPRGAPVVMLIGAPIAEDALNGVVSEWSGKACRIELAPAVEPPPLMRGSPLEVVSPRLDGVYRVPGMVTRIIRENLALEEAAIHTLVLKVDCAMAQRVQQRQFFRLRGGWRATLTSAGEGGRHRTDAEMRSSVHVLVWNLSAGGMLIEDPERRLSPGDTFAAAIDLRDGAEPVCLRAEVIRREERSPEELPQWGCRFIDLTVEDESRIIYHLQERIRARFAVKRRPEHNPPAETA
jgi:hypothetical protein